MGVDMADMVVPVGFANLKIQFQVTGSTKTFSTTYGIEVLDPSDDGQVAVDAFYGSFVSADRPCHDEEVLTGWTVLGMSGIYQTEDGPLAVASSDAAIDGSKSSADGRMIVNSALIVTKRSTLASRTGRGRGYWPFLWFGESSVNIDGSIATTGALDVVRDLFAATVSDWESATDYRPVILHAEGSPGSSTPRTITSLVCQNLCGTQRRRIR
jgi:hypothetical protein